MADKHFIQHAIKHPGRIKKAEARDGISVHQEAEKFAHSDDASKRSAGNLALRFEKGGDLHHNTRMSHKH